jgi:hypothetical protein
MGVSMMTALRAVNNVIFFGFTRIAASKIGDPMALSCRPCKGTAGDWHACGSTSSTASRLGCL